MKELINLDIPYENKLELINTIKLLLYKKEPRIFEELVLDDESFFNQDINGSLNVLKSILYHNNKYVIEKRLKEFKIINNLPNILKPFFFEFYRGNITNPNPNFKNTWEDYTELAKKSINIIEEELPVFYNELIFSNNTLFFHDNTKIINFVTKKTQGLLYFNTLPENNEIYFLS